MSMSLSHQSSDFDIYVGNKRGGTKPVVAGGKGAASMLRAIRGGAGGSPLAGGQGLGASPGQGLGGRGGRGEQTRRGNQDHDDHDLEDSEEHPTNQSPTSGGGSSHHQSVASHSLQPQQSGVLPKRQGLGPVTQLPHSSSSSQQQEQTSSPSSSVFRRVLPSSSHPTPSHAAAGGHGNDHLDTSILSEQSEERGSEHDKGRHPRRGIPQEESEDAGGGGDEDHPHDADPRKGHAPGARPGGGGGHSDMMLDTSLSVLEDYSSFEASSYSPGNG